MARPVAQMGDVMDACTASSVPELRLLGSAQAALYLGITPRSLQRLVARRILTPIRLPDVRRTLFDKADLEALIMSARAQRGPKAHDQAIDAQP